MRGQTLSTDHSLSLYNTKTTCVYDVLVLSTSTVLEIHTLDEIVHPSRLQVNPLLSIKDQGIGAADKEVTY